MKTKIYTLLLAVVASVGILYAEKVQIDDLYYNLDATSLTATVTYKSSDTYNPDHPTTYYNLNWKIESAQIPESVNYGGKTYKVTSIGDYAFCSCGTLAYVTIPNSITSIGYYAFKSCGVTSISIGKSVTNIDSKAFMGCSQLQNVVWNIINYPDFEDSNNTLFNFYVREGYDGNFDLRSQVTSFVFGDEVEHIPAYLCYGMNNLSSVNIGKKVKSIGDDAFCNCSGLTSIEIPSSVTSIGNSAFYGCSGLTSIEIPNSVISIGNSAFRNCTGLTSVTIGTSVTSIGNSAFLNCTALTSVTIPNGVTSIGEWAFYGCYGLTSVEIPNSVTSIENCTFHNCSGLTSVSIPSSVTSIGNSAFDGCSGLTAVHIGDLAAWCNISFSNGTANPLCYAKHLYYNDSEITDLIIPNSVTSIGKSAFYGCSGLTSVEIPNSITSIGNDAFYGCSGLTSVEIPNSITSIGNDAFYKCSSLTSVTINSDSIVSKTYSYNSSLQVIFGSQVAEYILGDSIKKIGQYAFSNCTALTSVTIPNGVTSIGEWAFYGCYGLTSVEIPNSVTSIENYTFYKCSGLTSVEIPNSITSIGNDAFYGCSGLTSIVIPNSVTSIGSYAFDDCSSLTSVILNSDSIVSKAYTSNSNIEKVFGVQVSEYILGDSITSIGNDAFYGCSGLTSVTIGNSVTNIGKEAFRSCSSLRNIEIPNSVISIENSAFNGCYRLTNVSIGNKVAKIGDNAFKDCTRLTSVTLNSDPIVSKTYTFNSNLKNIFGSQVTEYILGDSVTNIGDYAFYNCSTIKNVTIPSSVISIGDATFYGCKSLPNMTIPNSVISIGEGAFLYCTGLTGLTISNSIKFISNYAFEYCSGLTSIEIPNSVTSIGNSAFYGCSGLTSVEMLSDTPPSLGTSVFQNCDKLSAIYVPCGRLNSYIYSWSSYLSILEYKPTEFNVEGKINLDGAGRISVDNNICASSISAIPNYGHHFTQWSDGNTDNPRFIELAQDTTFTAVFAIDKSGTCGDNNALTWRYDSDTKTLTISGYGNLCTNKRYGLEAANELNTLIIENGLQAIGDSAFFNMATLTSVSIPNSVTSIGTRAFQGCSSLPSITIPENVTSFGSGATFRECSALTSVQWNAKNCVISKNGSNWTPPFYLLDNLTNFTFGENVESIPATLCAGLSGVTSIVLPEKVKSIGINAFISCTGLTSIVLPNSLTQIDDYAFAYCSGITNVVIPKNITNIGYAPFYGCSNLTSVECEVLTPPIGSYIFNSCSNLSSIFVPCGTLDAYRQSWSDYADIIRYHTLGYTITGNVNIAEAGNVTAPITICDDTIIVATPNYGYHFTRWSDGNKDNPRTIKLTKDTTFTAEFAISRTGTCGDDNLLTWTYNPEKKALTISGNGTLNSNYTYGLEAPTNIQKLEILTGVTSIGNSAFANEANLTSVKLPNTLTTIGDHAFVGCKKLKEINIPSSVTDIGIAAFKNGNRLETIHLGAGVENIGDSAFANCPYILYVYAYMEYPPVIDASVFVGDGDLSLVDLFVLEDSYARYRKTAVWKDFNLQITDMPTFIDHVSQEPAANNQKLLHDGQIFILRGDKTYTVTGQEVR